MTRFLAAQLARDHYFDITAAKQVLGYRPTVTTQAGLRQLRDAWQSK
jgi:nucleoside-diphosphate-sugar epimerase